MLFFESKNGTPTFYIANSAYLNKMNGNVCPHVALLYMCALMLISSLVVYRCMALGRERKYEKLNEKRGKNAEFGLLFISFYIEGCCKNKVKLTLCAAK